MLAFASAAAPDASGAALELRPDIGDDAQDISLQLDTLERMLTQLYELGDPADDQIISAIEDLAADVRADLERRGASAVRSVEPV